MHLERPQPTPPAWGTTLQQARLLLMTMAWPAAAAVSLAVAVHGRSVDPAGLWLLGCGTAAAYGLDRLIDRRDQDPRSFRQALFLGIVLVSAGTGVLACTAWWRFKVCLVLSLIAGAYVPLKRWIPKNVMTTLAWTTAIATLPLAGLASLADAWSPAVGAVACIMAANTLLCDLPDVATDRQAGVRGITPHFGVRVGATVAVAFALLGALVAGQAGRGGLGVTALGLAVLAVLLARPPHRGLYRFLADALVVLLPGPLSLLLG